MTVSISPPAIAAARVARSSVARGDGGDGGEAAKRRRGRGQGPAYTASLTTVAPSPPSLGPADS